LGGLISSTVGLTSPKQLARSIETDSVKREGKRGENEKGGRDHSGKKGKRFFCCGTKGVPQNQRATYQKRSAQGHAISRVGRRRGEDVQKGF